MRGTRPLGVGLVGLGYASDFHLPAVLSLPALRLVAVCDQDRARLADGARRHAVDAVSDYRALLDRADVDVIGILTPPSSHLEITLAALAAGKHMLLEKPIAPTLADADRMIAAAERSASKVCVAYVLRFVRQVQAMRALLSNGSLGELEILRCAASTPEMLSPTAPEHRKHRGEGGGSVIELGVHHYDLWAHLLGSRVTEVNAVSRSIRFHDQSTIVSATMSCGTLATTCVSLCGAEQYQVEVIGSRARATGSLLRFDGLEVVQAGDGAGHGLWKSAGLARAIRALPHALRVRRYGGTFRASFRELWRHFAEAIRDDVQPEPGLRAGRDSLAAAIASSRASLGGGAVRVADVG